MQFLKHFHEFGKLIIQFILPQKLGIWDWCRGFRYNCLFLSLFPLIWSLCWLLLLGLLPLRLIFWAKLVHYLSFLFFYYWCLPRVANSLPLLNVIALTCSLPSPLEFFFSELLFKELCYLLVNRLAIWPYLHL